MVGYSYLQGWTNKGTNRGWCEESISICIHPSRDHELQWDIRSHAWSILPHVWGRHSDIRPPKSWFPCLLLESCPKLWVSHLQMEPGGEEQQFRTFHC
jgi:hypothetical protein